VSGPTPGYGETPLPHDELTALIPDARAVLPDPPTKLDVYDLEQAFETRVRETLSVAVLGDEISLDQLLTDHFLRNLHRQLYGAIWTWAGQQRKLETNIGVAPEQIAMETRASFDTLRYRWEHTDDWTAAQLGIAAHADLVRIHPFVDGNGRSTRLLADLVFLAAQDAAEPPAVYDWDVDKQLYVEALRRYDRRRDPTELAALIGTRLIEE
jgi:fido (protein-threonine AMPylation protein)